MSVYRPTWKRDGKESTSRFYWMDTRVCGKRVRKSLGVTDKRIALQKEAAEVRKMEMQAAGFETHADTAEAKVDTLVTEYEQELVRRRSSSAHVKHTIKRVKDVLGRARTLTEVTPPRIRKALSRIGAKGLTPKTVNAYRVAVSGFFGWLVQEGRWPTNPVQQVKRVKETETERPRRAFTTEELEALLDAAPEERSVCYRMAATTGLRRSELGALTWGDIDLDAATVRVRASTAKNRKTTYLPLPDGTVAALRALGPADAGEPVFRFIPSTKRLREDLEAAEVEYTTAEGTADFHALRVTYATMLARAGVSLVQAQKLMRHSDPKLTANIYTRLQLDDAHAAVAKIAI